ncbi:hypothetical protein IM816_16520 [Luteibacter flocculans]|uniref:Uncharacterized protein n=1 Tax=Luteibacter flocculans TaxID=2780091 RepID=A0ABY4T250_9GAMM|nr:hypothetical protein [Luteibacter flocculans]URL58180.1 hypothetical protein IM816_16520 [Luteibacter flocculans]
MSDDSRDDDQKARELPKRTPFLTPATIKVIDEIRTANSSMAVQPTAGTGVGKGQGQRPEVQTDANLTPGAEQSAPPVPAATGPLSKIEEALAQTDNRIRLLVELLSTVFSDANRADKERQDKKNLRIAASSLRLSARSIKVAVRSLWIVAVIGVIGDGFAWWYGHAAVMSGKATDDRNIAQAADQLTATQKLVDSQAAEIELLKQQLAVMQHLNEVLVPSSTPSSKMHHLGRSGGRSSPGAM